jgi:parallel beta-helix repeat protein
MSNKGDALATSFQGIGGFDGEFHNWLIEDNLILTPVNHGINLSGSHNSIIRNNTVVNNDPEATRVTTWIRVSNHKNGTPSLGNTIQNNITNIVAASTTSSVLIGNVTLVKADYANYFTDVTANNFRLKASAPIQNVGPRTFRSLNIENNVSVPTPDEVIVRVPTVTISSSVATATVGTETTLTWNSTNATRCVASGDWVGTKAVNASEVVNLGMTEGTKVFTLQCSNTSGSKSSTVRVPVFPAGIAEQPNTTQQTVAISGLQAQQTVTGNIQVEAIPSGFTKVTSVKFVINGAEITTETRLPYSLGGDDGVGKLRNFDTTKLPNGLNTLQVTVTGDNSIIKKDFPFFVINSQSTLTTQGIPVYTTDIVNVRITPNGTKLGTQPKGTYGVKETTSAPAVITAGYRWIYVDFPTGVDGYVAETFLSATPTNQSVITNTEEQIKELLRQITALQAVLAALKTAQ